MSVPYVIAAYGFFWGPDRSGYLALFNAGIYTEEEAKRQERERPSVDLAVPLADAIRNVYDRMNPEILRALVAEDKSRRVHPLDDRPEPEDPALPVLSPTWPYVLAFAVRMEAKLEANRHKGNREGWLNNTPDELLERLDQGRDELWRLLSEDPVALHLVPDEAADVANFAMMIADVCGGVKP